MLPTEVELIVQDVVKSELFKKAVKRAVEDAVSDAVNLDEIDDKVQEVINNGTFEISCDISFSS